VYAQLFFHFVSLILFRRNKAVADGAVSFYLDRRVSVRVAKTTYGVECVTLFEPDNMNIWFGRIPNSPGFRATIHSQ